MPEIEFEQLPFDHPVYIMYSSGTTGMPKCIVQVVPCRQRQKQRLDCVCSFSTKLNSSSLQSTGTWSSCESIERAGTSHRFEERRKDILLQHNRSSYTDMARLSVCLYLLFLVTASS